MVFRKLSFVLRKVELFEIIRLAVTTNIVRDLLQLNINYSWLWNIQSKILR